MIGYVGTVVNFLTVILGSAIGILLKKGIPKQMTDTLFKALGLVTVYMGISGSIVKDGSVLKVNTLIIVLCIIVGTVIGELIDIDKQINKAGSLLEKKLGNKPNSQIAQGFVSASMLFCIGSMTIVGCMNAGLKGDNSILFTKSALDLCSSMIFASTMGIGVMFSAVFVLVYQGALTLLAVWISPYLTTPVTDTMTCIGYILIIALGLTMLGAIKIKVSNLVVSMFLPVLFCPLWDWLITLLPFLNL